MDQTSTPPQALTPDDKQNDNDVKTEIFEEEEEIIQIQVQSHTINEEITQQKTINNVLMDEITQTDSTVFAKIQDDLPKTDQSSPSASHSLTQTEIMSVQIEDNRDQYDKFMEREFYPQFKANEEKIDSQIEKIDNAIAKLRFLTDNFNEDIDITPSTSTSASIDHFPNPLKIKTTKKALKKKKAKNTAKIPIENYVTSKKTRKRTIKHHKRFLSPLKMTTEKRLDMLMKKKSNDQISSENPIYIPRGLSQFDPIVLRSGYPIVFEYEPKEPVRHERIPHGPLRTLFKNGDIKYEFHEGTVRIKTTTGFTYTYYTNGDKQQEFPDGASAYRYNSNGSVEFRCVDKTLMYFFENGQIEEHFSNGQTRVRFPDRSEVKIFADNSFIFKDRKGNIQRGTLFNENLRKQVRSPSTPGSPGEMSTPTPRKRIPVSTSLTSQNNEDDDKGQLTPRENLGDDKK